MSANVTFTHTTTRVSEARLDNGEIKRAILDYVDWSGPSEKLVFDWYIDLDTGEVSLRLRAEEIEVEEETPMAKGAKDE